ncbi:hypothetical protein J2S41_006402 [Catenuloplanes atrovinosus]|uniref:DUF2530 domain-containing protein n=2 Tax=Catenuloplanes atrovinosus TaxID=137266 RepID=A0AAE3YWL2_9ACTN|nr:hypothetical protein [Catenuloplanes atrovinosus]
MARSPVPLPTSDMTPDDRPSSPEGPRPRPTPLDPPMVPFAVGGTIAWALAGLVLVVFFRDWLDSTGRTDWLWICLTGFLLGFPGTVTMMRHDAHRRRRRRTQP